MALEISPAGVPGVTEIVEWLASTRNEQDRPEYTLVVDYILSDINDAVQDLYKDFMGTDAWVFNA